MVVAYDDLHRSLLNAADSFACHASGSPTSRSYGRCLSWRHYTPTVTDSSLVANIFLPLYKYLLAAPFPCITILSTSKAPTIINSDQIKATRRPITYQNKSDLTKKSLPNRPLSGICTCCKTRTNHQSRQLQHSQTVTHPP